MSTIQKNLLIKVIGLIILLLAIWLIGYFSGLEIGQKKAIQEFSLQNQQKQNFEQNNQLPQIPAGAEAGANLTNNAFPEIPKIIK
ncbi:MAG: hypothetical protein WCV73_01360 [Patescibacteria group bacterium]|jgi:hypothetical protein